MEFTKDYKCKYCNKSTNRLRGEVEFDLVIPEEILPKEFIKNFIASYYTFAHHHFCNGKCYNLKVIDDIVEKYKYSLKFPEEHYLPLHMERDIANAEKTKNKLEEFKAKLLLIQI